MACKRVILESADSDRKEIVAYLTATTGTTRAASAFLDDMDQAVDMICQFPTMHALSRMPKLAGKGYRIALVGSYAMLYTYVDDTVFIEHVFHQRQDYARMI